MDIEKRLSDLGITVPCPPNVQANYVAYKIVDKMVYISGQLPFAADGSLIKGVASSDSDLLKAGEAARLCGLNIIANLKKIIDGDWSRFASIVKLGGFVASSANFTKHPLVINHASDLMVSVFADAGKHCRFAVGVSSLPLGAIVEIEAIALLNK